MLTIQGLSYAYSDRFLFKNLSFDLVPGELIQLKGRNGSGKTTLIKVLCGILKNYEGSISLVNNLDSEGRNEIFYLGHKNALKDNLTVLENLKYDYRSDGIELTRLKENLATLGLENYFFSKVSDLSEGQKRKIILSCFMASNKSIYLLDEPLINLDEESKKIVSSEIENKINGGSSIIFTSHEKNILATKDINLDEYAT
ncbi:MAG: heme ABC exporter ATP-binding protein CcmA [Proteobacteria bacterium]|nr:heme ABC exporter ATP-binding protein CcmA [Pseudomonadota bacterium]|tara:strand:+ start:383 stop:982 length:600 start_codon:yes stop_codon:yes gene_type:complete